MSASNHQEMDTVLQSTLTQLQRAARGETVEFKNFSQIEQAVISSSVHQLPLLHVIAETATNAAFATVDTLLTRKKKSPTDFLQEFASAGTISLSALFSAGAKIREFQADLPDLSRGATVFLIARAARQRIQELSSPELQDAHLPKR